MIQEKLGSTNIFTNLIAWITGTIAGPIISFFNKNGFKDSDRNFRFCISF